MRNVVDIYRVMRREFESVEVSHCYGEQNRVANGLVKMNLTLERSVRIWDVLPNKFQSNLDDDHIGVTRTKRMRVSI